jgi:hypothetical protein
MSAPKMPEMPEPIKPPDPPTPRADRVRNLRSAGVGPLGIRRQGFKPFKIGLSNAATPGPKLKRGSALNIPR